MAEGNRNGMGGKQTPDRRDAFMTGTQGEQRVAVRLFATLPVTIYADGVRHVGLVRDFSANGLFLYSDFQPTYGATLQLTLRLRKNVAKHLAAECRGKVVRVEAGATGVAIGIALQLEEYEIRRGAPSSDHSSLAATA